MKFEILLSTLPRAATAFLNTTIQFFPRLEIIFIVSNNIDVYMSATTGFVWNFVFSKCID